MYQNIRRLHAGNRNQVRPPNRMVTAPLYSITWIGNEMVLVYRTITKRNISRFLPEKNVKC